MCWQNNSISLGVIHSYLEVAPGRVTTRVCIPPHDVSRAQGISKTISLPNVRYARDTFSICSHIAIFQAIEYMHDILYIYSSQISLKRNRDNHVDAASIFDLKEQRYILAIRTGH